MNRDTVVQENIHCRICLISFKLIDLLSFILFSINSMWLETLKSQHRLNQTCSPLYIFTIYTLFNVKISFYSTYFRIFFMGKNQHWWKYCLRSAWWEKCQNGSFSSPLEWETFSNISVLSGIHLVFFYMLWQWHGWNISHNQIITLAMLLHCKPQPILASTFHHMEILSHFWKQSLQGIKYSLVSDGRLSSIHSFKLF